MKKNIVWLASYPKSGNTWFRIFLSNLRSEKAAPVDINGLCLEDIIYSSRTVFNLSTGIDSLDLSNHEASQMQKDAVAYYAQKKENELFIKVHDAYTYLPFQSLEFPDIATLAAIYIIRNPLDVCVSLAFHDSKSINQTIEKMCTSSTICKTDYERFPQNLLSWDRHVISWENSPIPKKIIRYEDLKQNPLNIFSSAIRFFNWQYLPDEIEKAINHSNFKHLQSQESQKIFKERNSKQKQFFRKGIVGDWKNYLTKNQINLLIDAFYPTMVKYGYLTESGMPIG